MIKVITGNEAAAYGALLSRPDVVTAYPITPQSRISEQLSEFYAQGLLQGKFVNVESEVAAIGYVIGASSAGVRVFTATASQGLAIMHEQLHWASGSCLPIVMANVNRPIAAPWNLVCDQTDSLSQRDTGWMQFYCESNQEVLDTVIQAYRISEMVDIPSMVCLDGVFLSLTSESTDIPEQEKVDEYLPPYAPEYLVPEPDRRYKIYEKRPAEAGGYDWNVSYLGVRYEQHKRESKCVEAVLKANREYEKLFGRGYPPVEEYKCEDADVVVLASGSHAGTCRDVIDELRNGGYKVGLVKLKMFRPFPKELVRNALTGRKKVAVIERDISVGQCGIFYQETNWAMNGKMGDKSVGLYGFVSGLGGADITPELIKKAILFTINEDPPDDDVIWLGLPEKEIADEYDQRSIKIY